MNAIKKGLPSVFTSLGLISGCLSIVYAISHKDLNMAGYFILVAAIFDFLDGMAARLFNSISAFGKQLDSLADVVSFGVAPAMILYQLLILTLTKSSPDFDYTHPNPGQSVLVASAFLVAVFSALRLAKFNLDPEQVKNFKGLATPANAIFLAALGFMAESSREFPLKDFVFNRYFLLSVIILSCYLLVSDISMFSLKFSSFGIRKNLMRYLFLVVAVILIAATGLPGLAPVIAAYIIMSLINNWFVKME
jgi:CDP-diacylglycerol---serine O-phosphatidyltransferase